MTEEKRLEWLAEVKQAAIDDRAPNPVPGIHPMAEGPRRPDVAQPVASDEGGVFTGNNLTPALLSKSRKYEVPGTGLHLWVFPAAPEDVKAMVAWSLQPDLLQPDSSDPRRAHRARSDMEIDLKVAQVILCTRQGPSRDARQCFGFQHRPALGTMLGWSTIQEICRISDELNGDEEALGASTRRFFTALLASSRTLLSACATWDACPPGLTDTLTRLLLLGTRATSRGSVDSGLMDELRELEGRVDG